MRAEKIENVFGFTAYVDEGLEFKHWIFRPAEKQIEQNLNLGNYTDILKVKEIIFAFQIEPEPAFFQFKNRFAYKKGIIYLYGKIDYETFRAANEKEALVLMCESYLQAVLSISGLRGMKKVQFDAEKLHSDLKALFLEKGFLS